MKLCVCLFVCMMGVVSKTTELLLNILLLIEIQIIPDLHEQYLF